MTSGMRPIEAARRSIDAEQTQAVETTQKSYR